MLHAIAFAPESCLGGGFLTAPWEDVAVALQISAYSLKSLAVACRPLMQRGGSIVGLDFDNSRNAWPVYDWMGVAKAAFESTARYLARDLGPDGIRVNLVAAGPLRTIAAKSIPGFEQFEDVWAERAPLGWDVKDAGAGRVPRASRCSPTCSPRRPARCSTSTAASTPSARSRRLSREAVAGSPLREDRDEGLDPRRLAPAGELVPHRFLDEVRRLVERFHEPLRRDPHEDVVIKIAEFVCRPATHRARYRAHGPRATSRRDGFHTPDTAARDLHVAAQRARHPFPEVGGN